MVTTVARELTDRKSILYWSHHPNHYTKVEDFLPALCNANTGYYSSTVNIQ